ncbi:MAG: hypothetical protein KC470_11630 [Dehalococcoidia bacterium]|nr:hypothetical protein [Dehalococcoidia bacterium]
MGASYQNMMLLEASLDAATAALADFTGWLAAERDVVVLFLDDEGDPFDPALPRSVSEAIDSPVVRFSVFDDEVLTCEVWRQGQLAADATTQDMGEYMGLNPDELAGIEEAASMAGFEAALASGAEAFASAVSRGDQAAAVAALSSALHEYHPGSQEELLRALDLPTFAIGWDYGRLRAVGDTYSGPELIDLSA